ncbi:hypothetical protein V1L54_09960 [Streptomyces sp. TRM 70361]|uniref:hypothetical protein n=1 Tax=Streptomyces sp. TRM 70361 TaxID=3116553 RepID=UPI002E7B77DB|nr:hypothetical protein [Streptomyces sp. TRM 70361]MEE1939727.1 hypothetical protein [Streptomyces sp. TRM 70361]
MATVVLVTAGAFTAGRLTAVGSEADSGTAACEDAEQAFMDAFEEAQRYQPDPEDPYRDADPDQARHHASIAANVVLQNPECFDAKTRATVQTFLDAVQQ